MNTMEKYVCAYIVECMTGVRGSNPDRVYEVLRTMDTEFNDVLLSIVATVAHNDPENEETKKVVQLLVTSYIIDIEAGKIEAEKKAKEEAEKKANCKLVFERDGDILLATTTLSRAGQSVEAILKVPFAYKNKVAKRFAEQFPGGTIVDRTK